MDKETLYRFFNDQATEQEQKRVLDWLDESPEHRRELLAERKLFDSILLLGDVPSVRKRKSVFTLSRTIREVMRYAAVVLVMAGAGTLYLSHLRKQMLSAVNTITIPAGQRANLVLPDGTKVCMNALSELKYPSFFSGKKRSVELTGEAFFDVTHDKDHPFVVKTFTCDVEVLGTEFNVESRPERREFTASLVTGKVRVTDRENGNSVTLSPSEQATLNDGRLVVGLVPDGEHFAWREGLIAFRNASLVSLLDEFGKYYDVKIVTRFGKTPANLFTGKIRIADGLDQALWALQRNGDFTYLWNEAKDTVYIRTK